MNLATELGLPCRMHADYVPTDISRTVDYFIATDVFGVPPYDEKGNQRHFGVYSNPGADSQAVFWIITVTSSRPVSVRSEYDVMLLSIEQPDFVESTDSVYNFIVHPVPIRMLQQCQLFPQPRIWVSNDDGDLDLRLVRRTLTGRGGETVWIDPWSPAWRYDKTES